MGLLIEHGLQVDAVPEGYRDPDMQRPKSKEYPTAIHLAIEEGNCEMVRLLLKNGADLSARNENGESALEYASRVGSREMNEIVAGSARAAAIKKAVRLVGCAIVFAVLCAVYFKSRRHCRGETTVSGTKSSTE